MFDKKISHFIQLIMGFWMFFLASTPLAAQVAETALDRYVARPDPSYTFTERSSQRGFGYTAHFLAMTSQQWRSADEVDRPLWTHEVVMVIPQFGLDKTDTAVLLIDGGDNNDTPMNEVDPAIGAVAVARGLVIAIIRQVPNQPLFFADEAGIARKEDAILAYSLDKALDTGDMEWAVHLAMTKAAVRAMDTVQTFAASKGKTIKDFLVLGGSKRGWTTWLAAAVDPRIRAIVPASIDMPNLGQQFIRHWEAYGFYAPALTDYVEFDLPCRTQTSEGRALLQVIDPYAYRDRYTMPKLILNATGDQFFTSDSSRFYYGSLPGPKWLRYAPNTDHKQSENVIFSGLSWMDDMLDNKISPRMTWALEGEGTLRISTTSIPKEVKLWQATNPSARDFRLEAIGPVWTSQTLSRAADGTYSGTVQKPATGWTAFLVQATFEVSGPEPLNPNQVYTTGVQIIPDTLPFAGTACGGLQRASLESPQQRSSESGIGVIRGWVCNANSVEMQIDEGARRKVVYGLTRKDTVEVCGDDDNGFSHAFNWNVLGAGNHRLRAFADGLEFADVTFNVTTLGVNYLRGASGEYLLPNFLQTGQSTAVRWAESHQNFVIADASQPSTSVPASAAPLAAASPTRLESPQQGSFESGMGLIRGWVCDANLVEVQINDEPRFAVAYGATRRDTARVCGDADNGFSYMFNWNTLGTGTHRLRAFADGAEFANATFNVMTLGVDYLQGASGQYTLPNFPQEGQSVTLRWIESYQNFVIINHQ